MSWVHRPILSSSSSNERSKLPQLSSKSRLITTVGWVIWRPILVVNSWWDIFSQTGNRFADSRIGCRDACRQTGANPVVQAEDRLRRPARTRVGCASSASTPLNSSDLAGSREQRPEHLYSCEPNAHNCVQSALARVCLPSFAREGRESPRLRGRRVQTRSITLDGYPEACNLHL